VSRCDHSESRSSSGPLAAHGPLAGPATGSAEICMRIRVGPLLLSLTPLRVEQLLRPARGQRSQEWSRGRWCRDVHAMTRSSRSESSSSSGPLTARDPKNGLAAGGAKMRMRRRVAPAARTRPMVPVEPTADGAALYSAGQLQRGPRTAHGPSWSRGRRCPAEHAARCQSSGVADGVVNQVGPSGTAHGSSELVQAHTPRRGRPSCRNKD
jgi:hypothetical protein